MMRKYILLALLPLCLWACSEDEIKPYHGEQYLYFNHLKDGEEEEISVSFNNYPTSDEVVVKIGLALIGKPFEKDAPYKLVVVNEEVKEGETPNSMPGFDQISIVFNNVLSKPMWWNSEVTKLFLGTYSRKKYVEFVTFSGISNFGALSTAEKRQASLEFKYYVAENNIMDKDDKTGQEFPMEIPVD